MSPRKMVSRAKGRVGSAGYHHFIWHRGPVAQLGARLTGSQKVRGSNPLGSTTQHLVSIKPRCGVGAGFVVACCAVSDMTTGLVTIQIGCCPSLDAMNTGHAAVTWLNTVGIGSIRVGRFARGWRPCNGGWDEVGRR